MHLVLNSFFKIEQVPAYIELSKNYQLKKMKKRLIMNYIATVISTSRMDTSICTGLVLQLLP